jgi:hypothetical protein
MGNLAFSLSRCRTHTSPFAHTRAASENSSIKPYSATAVSSNPGTTTTLAATHEPGLEHANRTSPRELRHDGRASVISSTR